jgi:hypothetical protein
LAELLEQLGLLLNRHADANIGDRQLNSGTVRRKITKFIVD